MKNDILKAQEKELEEINREFHEVIAEKKHCYERGEEEGGASCDCAFYYKKWVDTKKKHARSSG